MTPATSTLGAIAPWRAVTDWTGVGGGVAFAAGFPLHAAHVTAMKSAEKQANVWRITARAGVPAQAAAKTPGEIPSLPSGNYPAEDRD
jgi:hypothetical protein